MKKLIILVCAVLLTACEPAVKTNIKDGPYAWKQKFMYDNAVVLTDEQTGEKYSVTYYRGTMFTVSKINVPLEK